MKKNLLLVGAFVSLLNVQAQTQAPETPIRKWDPAIENLFQQSNNALPQVKANQAAAITGVIISSTDVAATADAILAAGHQATIINETIISANVPLHYIPVLAAMEEVNYINGAKQFAPTMHSSRKVTGVDDIHAGTGLETPFTGKGVIVGVIDQGFQYQHVGFLNKNNQPRVLAVWDHYNHQEPTQDIPSTGDNVKGTGGHGTHVANTAAGSKIEENPYYGMAPEADIIMIPSTFKSNDVLQEAKYISDFAAAQGKPYVINMSFGSQMGPHDGTDSYSQSMNSFSKKGGILVAAMGNEGELKLHAEKKFRKDNEKTNMLVAPGFIGYHYIDIWEQTADGQRHLTIRPFVYDISKKDKDFKNAAFWKSCLQMATEVDPNNQKEHYELSVNVNNLRQGNANLYFGVEIEGNKNNQFHVWVNPASGEIFKNSSMIGYLQGNNKYCVGEGAASIPMAIAVASFDGNDGSFVSAVTHQKGFYDAAEGDISTFSSVGPSLGDKNKPTIAAPGNVVASAISKYGDFNAKDPSIVSIVKRNDSKDYYAVMSGTSMASPAVTGIVALWLEAYPLLSFEEIETILQETSTRDEFTGTTKVWDEKRGYGKINAYAGLKKVLELAEISGINDQLNSETPISIQKDAHQFRILFNNDESYAHIALYNASGVAVKHQQLNDIRRGHETVLTTDGLPAGVYVVRINTTASTAAKKMLVK